MQYKTAKQDRCLDRNRRYVSQISSIEQQLTRINIVETPETRNADVELENCLIQGTNSAQQHPRKKKLSKHPIFQILFVSHPADLPAA